MTPTTLLHADPLTRGWLIAIALLLGISVVIPIARALVAGIIYFAASITGRRELRGLAARVMPRVAHLIGGVIIGTVSIAAPAMATPAQPDLINAIDADRDAGASATHVPTTAAKASTAAAVAHDMHAVTATGAPAPTPQSRVTARSESTAETAAESMYVVRSGDTLWGIAVAELEDGTPAEITATWKAIWRTNRDIIGDDPGLILPGQRLDLSRLA